MPAPDFPAGRDELRILRNLRVSTTMDARLLAILVLCQYRQATRRTLGMPVDGRRLGDRLQREMRCLRM
jgi:hypothetical protein